MTQPYNMFRNHVYVLLCWVFLQNLALSVCLTAINFKMYEDMSNSYAYILLCQETRLADLAKRYESQLKKITTELKSKAKELDAAR